MREDFYDGESFKFEHNGATYIATITRDDHHGAPWDEECGHGDVSEWTTRPKLPGEMVLSEDRGAKRFYDFAGACRIARRDGWGFLPEPVRVERREGGGLTGAALPTYRSGDFSIVSDCPSEAYAELYRMHRETLTAREYAAGAAMADFERLRAWCDGEWFYAGVTVRRAEACTYCGETESLWGIESDAGEYIRGVATELADQLADQLAECTRNTA